MPFRPQDQYYQGPRHQYSDRTYNTPNTSENVYEEQHRGRPDDYYVGRQQQQQQPMGQPPQGYYGGQQPQMAGSTMAPPGFNPGMYPGMSQGNMQPPPGFDPGMYPGMTQGQEAYQPPPPGYGDGYEFEAMNNAGEWVPANAQTGMQEPAKPNPSVYSAPDPVPAPPPGTSSKVSKPVSSDTQTSAPKLPPLPGQNNDKPPKLPPLPKVDSTGGIKPLTTPKPAPGVPTYSGSSTVIGKPPPTKTPTGSGTLTGKPPATNTVFGSSPQQTVAKGSTNLSVKPPEAPKAPKLPKIDTGAFGSNYNSSRLKPVF